MKYDKVEEPGKLFVGGLSWETSKESLQSYFSQYGEVVECIVPKDTTTGRSRGFGFVTFKDESIVSVVLSSRPHLLDGRAIDAKACSNRNQHKQSIKSDDMPKVFLGGISSTMSDADLREAFSRFGTVVDVAIMYDQETGKCRGFGFLSFDNEDSVRQACNHRYLHVGGKQIEVKPATRRPQQEKGGPAQRSPYGMWDGQQASGGGQFAQWSNNAYSSSGSAGDGAQASQASYSQYEWGPSAQQYLAQAQASAAAGYSGYPSYYGAFPPAASYGSYGTDGASAGFGAAGYAGYGAATEMPTPSGVTNSEADAPDMSQYATSKSSDKEENSFGGGFDGQDYRSGNYGTPSGGASNRSQQNYHPYRR